MTGWLGSNKFIKQILPQNHNQIIIIIKKFADVISIFGKKSSNMMRLRIYTKEKNQSLKKYIKKQTQTWKYN